MTDFKAENALMIEDLTKEFPDVDTQGLSNQLETYGKLFAEHDHDNSGDMDIDEVDGLLQELDIQLDKFDLRDIISRVDDDNSGTLRYREFLNLMLIQAGWIARPLEDKKQPAKRVQKHRHGAVKKVQRGHLHVKLQLQTPDDAPWTLTCTIGSGKNLLSADLFGTSDPYVKCYVMPDPKKKTKQKTTVCRQTLNPTFDQTLAWTFPQSETYKDKRLYLGIWDKDFMSRNDFMGAMAFDLAEVANPDVTIDGWYVVLDRAQGQSQHFPSKVSDDGQPPDIKRLDKPAASAIKTRRGTLGEVPQITPAHFNYLKVLGRGAFGKVLLAEAKDSKQVFALKVLKKAAVVEDDDVGATMTEKMILSIDGDPKFLITCVASFQTKGNLFFVMNLVTGGDLMFHAMNDGAFSERRTAFYTAEICCGLFFLHDRGIVYRDLKLDNVMLDAEGHVKLADFGLCKVLGPGGKTRTFCGTPNYLAPEIVEFKSYGPEVDYWSLGVIVFEMINGMTLFDADDEEELFHYIKHQPIRLPRTMPKGAYTACKAFLQRDPTQRLGYGETGKDDIMAQTLFNSLSWDEVEAREATPPFVPKGGDPKKADNFDPEFTDQKPIVTPPDKKAVAGIDAGMFDGFTYVHEDFVV
eukprot:m.233395 g.233395  ORF g.233395 m.233395 type:complete len:635 (+) comp18900_c0_seq2:2963-4867(+)